MEIYAQKALTNNTRRSTAHMKKNLDYIEIVSTLLNNKGISYRKHASTIATILGMHYNGAKQKLDGKRGITFDEVKSIFKYFNESFGGQRSHNCIFIMNNIHKRCIIEVDNKPVVQKEKNETYAIKMEDLFVINTNLDKEIKNEMYKVNSIDFMPPPKIAILDNNDDILDLLKRVAERYGIEADTFKNLEDINDAIDNNNYEAYILDWLLDFNLTAEYIVKKIRSKIEKDSKIMILTGELDHYENNIGEMILSYDVKLIEKPAKPIIISSLLLSMLFFN